jgi:hypothetical protein
MIEHRPVSVRAPAPHPHEPSDDPAGPRPRPRAHMTWSAVAPTAPWRPGEFQERVHACDAISADLQRRLPVHAEVIGPSPATGESASTIATTLFSQWDADVTRVPRLGDEAKLHHFNFRSAPISLRGRHEGVKTGVGCPLTPTSSWYSIPWISLAPEPDQRVYALLLRALRREVARDE